MQLVQMLLFLSARVAICIKETEPEELPTGRREGQAGQATFAQYSDRGSDRGGFCSHSLYHLKELSAEKEGNWMKRSRREQFLSSVIITTSPVKTKVLHSRSRTKVFLCGCLLILLVKL